MINLDHWLLEKQTELNWDFIGIAQEVSHQGKKEIRWLHVAGNQNESYRNIKLQVGRGIAGLVWKTGRLKADTQILADSQKRLEYPIARLEKLETTIAAPVLIQHEVLAVLMIGSREVKEITPAICQELTTASQELAVLIKGV